MLTRTNLRLFALSALCAVALAADASTDESTTTRGPIAGYIPNQAASLVGAAFYLVSAAVMWLHFFRSGRPWFLVILPVGMTLMVAGFLLRFYYAMGENSTKLMWYISFYSLLLLAPCAFLATDYIILPRLGRAMGDQIASSAFLVPVRFLLKFFVCSDVVTFLIQMGGGGLMAGGDKDKSELGTKVMIVGLIAQLISFGFYTIVLSVFGWRVHRHYGHLVRPTQPWRFTRFNPLSSAPVSDWRLLFWILVVTCVGILVRSVFRTIESAQGHDGYLATHEGWFYLFDALPLWIAMSLFAYCWPTRVFDGLTLGEGISPFADRHATFARRASPVYDEVDGEEGHGKGYRQEAVALAPYDRPRR
ncbi:hypothetical protein JCM10450v2_002612 [Rhodotorula kratochvilovae]